MKLTRRQFIYTGLAASAALVLTDAFWIEKFFIEHKEHYWQAATADTDNIKVVQITDLHLQKLNSQLKRLAQQINTQAPDLIVITGDAVDRAHKLPVLDELLALFDHHIPKVAILGNWEYWGKVDIDVLEELYRKHNTQLLINQSVQFKFKDKTLTITGVDDLLGGQADIIQAVYEYQPSDYHIILNHCPQYSEVIEKELPIEIPADFILSGHTHGGQFNLFGFTPFLPPGSGRYVKGWYDELSPKMYVSKGIGTTIFPARFGARAEVTTFYLKA